MLDWPALFDLASDQHGYFTSADAEQCGVSRSLLHQSQQTVAVEGYRGLHRFARYPFHPHDKFVAPFVWSREEGVVSHGSALDAVYDLSDYWHHGAITMTFPKRWRRKRIPLDQIQPHFADLPATDVRRHGAFMVTTAVRTVSDFRDSGARSDLVRQAISQGSARGLFSPEVIQGLDEVSS